MPRGLTPEHAVELHGVTHGLVQLQAELLAGEHERGTGRGARRRIQQRDRLGGHARGRPREVEREQVLPAGLSDVTGVRAGVGAHLGAALADRHRFEPAAALGQALLAQGAVGGGEGLLLEPRGGVRARHRYTRLRAQLGIGEREHRELVLEGDLKGSICVGET